LPVNALFLLYLIGTTYHIYPTPHEPHTCCYTKLLAWKALLELKTRSLQSNDLIFPNVDGKGVPKLLEELTQPRVQGFLDTFTSDIVGTRRGRFTTHCFRRGGAQHRFMFARHKWSLKAIKWWGGWSDGERTGTIMRYLLDEFVRYESGYSDMLSPDRDDSRHALFMGEGGSTELAVTPKSLEVELNSIKSVLMDALDHKFALMKLEMTHQGQQIVNRISTILAKKITVERIGTPDRLLVPFHELCNQEEPCHPEPVIMAPPHAPVSSAPGPLDVRPLAPKIPDAKDWLDCVKQWRYGDPSKNLHSPLVDWNAEMRKTDPQRYSQRKLIGEEFKRLNFSEAGMFAEHGLAVGTIKGLMQAIRDKNKRREAKENEDKDREETQRLKEASGLAISDLDAAHPDPIIAQEPTMFQELTAAQEPAVTQETTMAQEEEEEEEEDEPALIRGRTREKQVAVVKEIERTQGEEGREGIEGEQQKGKISSTRRRQASTQKSFGSPRRSKRVKTGN
jgi:hypothetical protein